MIPPGCGGRAAPEGGEPQPPGGPARGGVQHAQAELARRMAALEAALEPGRLWEAADGADERAEREAEDLLEQVAP